ncbi:MAG: hypothetical protein ABI967_11770 [bacterium]
MPTIIANQLPLAPLGAGDLIDRAVRLYRLHFGTLLRIAAPPVIVSAVGSVLFSIAWRTIFTTPSGLSLVGYLLLLFGGLGLAAGGHIFSLIVMGGAARNLVTHLLRNEPVSVRTTYAAVRARFWPLLGASVLMLLWIIVSFMVAFFGWYMVVTIVAVVGLVMAQIASPVFLVIGGAIGVISASAFAFWLFFFFVGRVAYVPQVMMVEGKGIFASVGRSFSLARGNVRRLMAMALFSYFTTWSALMILVIPLGWYGYLNGIDPSPWNATQWPAWYAIGYSVLEPLSSIVLAPVWMLGLSLLYVDERVRHEGYDIELMASQHLPEMPQLNVTSPFAPAISQSRPSFVKGPISSGNVLGLR